MDIFIIIVENTLSPVTTIRWDERAGLTLVGKLTDTNIKIYTFTSRGMGKTNTDYTIWLFSF